MSTNNKVYQVLVTKGNQALAAAGTKIDDLKDGQLGIFDYNTNLAVDPAVAIKEFYLAVGVDLNGDGVIDTINQSAGQVIQKENIRDYTFKPHSASRPMIFEITDYKANCDTEYAIKFEFRNMQVYMRQGYNQFAKTYAVKTSCCEECVDCPSGSPLDLTIKLLQALNSDPSGLFKAEAIAAPKGAVVENLDMSYGGNIKTLGIRVTTNPLAIMEYCNIPLMYYNPRQTVIVPSLIEGFACNGKITVTQEAADEEGAGVDIRNREYFAGGWNGRPGPYRVSSAVGVAIPGFKYFANADTKYDQFHLVYDQFSTAGWGEYLNNLMTLVAIPEAATTTRDAFATAMDQILGNVGLGFEALADDAAAAKTAPEEVEPTPPETPELDGIA